MGIRLKGDLLEMGGRACCAHGRPWLISTLQKQTWNGQILLASRHRVIVWVDIKDETAKLISIVTHAQIKTGNQLFGMVLVQKTLQARSECYGLAECQLPDPD